jgi:hypothetical protein
MVVGLNDDYSKGGKLVSSPLVDAINCTKGNGYTAYATALEMAQKELEDHGRPDAANVIVFLSDGAANIGPSDLDIASDYRRRPCRQGVNSAAAIKTKGTLIYSIGYDLNALGGGANVCQQTAASGAPGNPESPAITAYQALEQIATLRPDGTRAFFNKPSAGDLKGIFTEVAVDLQRGTSALIDNDRS